MPERRRCEWCGKDRRQFSEWEQQTIGIDGKSGEWMPLYRPCAHSRLKNPLYALLGMRKIGESE